MKRIGELLVHLIMIGLIVGAAFIAGTQYQAQKQLDAAKEWRDSGKVVEPVSERHYLTPWGRA